MVGLLLACCWLVVVLFVGLFGLWFVVCCWLLYLYLNMVVVDRGEGVMLRKKHSQYLCGRSKELVKLKVRS